MAASIRLKSVQGKGVILATVLGSGVAFLDASVVNVALPALQRSLGADLAGLQWVLDAYLLFLSALLLVGGSMGDRFGRRRLFLVGLVAFAGASVLCGLAPDVRALIAARALQGIGAALLVPGSLSLVKSSFVEEDQGAAVGAWAGLSGVSTAAGPMLGGWLIDVASWRWIFFINLPLVALAVWAALRFVPESRDPAEASSRPDVAGATLVTVGLAALVFALIEGPRTGWSTASVFALPLGLVCLGAFVVVQRRVANPMLPLELFHSTTFSGANAVTLAVYFALNGVFFLLVLQLQNVLGYSAFAAGASLTPVTVLMALLSAPAGRLGARVGHRWPMAVGAVLTAAGMVLLTLATPERGYVTGVLPGTLVIGLGLSAVVAPLTTAVLASVAESHSGLASGVNNAVARTAGLLAVALLPWLAAVPDEPDPAGFASAFRRAMWICAALCAASSVLSLATVRPPETEAGGPG